MPEKKEIVLTDKQKYILAFDKKYRPLHLILEGSVRSGKTWLNNLLWRTHVMETGNRNSDFIITGKTIGTIERNILKPLHDDWDVDTTLDKYNSFRMNGKKMNCFGADDQTAHQVITGMTGFGWYGNEITLQHKNVINECFNRLSGKGARIFWDTNPDYPGHYIKNEYIDKSGTLLENRRIRIKAFHFRLEDNPLLPVDYIENLKKNTPPGMWYDRKINGLWVAAEGVVYEGFRRDVHVIKPFKIPDNWQRIRAIDYGFTNPFVCLYGALDEDKRLYIYHEYYKNQTLLKNHAEYINSYEPGIRFSKTVADHDAQDNAELRSYGINTINAKKDVLIGIQKVAERLIVQADGKPRLFIFDTCKNFIDEIQTYRWQESKDGRPIKEEPLKVSDHVMDSTRYMCMSIDNIHMAKSGIGGQALGF